MANRGRRFLRIAVEMILFLGALCLVAWLLGWVDFQQCESRQSIRTEPDGTEVQVTYTDCGE